jgi:hypothetical protein
MKYRLGIVILLLLAVWVFMQYRVNKINRQLVGMYHQVASKDLVITGSAKNLKRLKVENDSLLKRLQEEVNKNTHSATVMRIVIRDTVYITRPVIVLRWDTLYLDGNQEVWPVYSVHHEDKWATIGGEVGRTQSMLHYSVRTELLVKQEYKRKFLGKGELMLDITHTNPNLLVVDKRSFAVDTPKQNRLLWMGIGFAAGVAAPIILAR